MTTSEAFLDVVDGRPRSQDVPELPLADYRRWVGRFPPPSDEQIRHFADFVFGAKSWYEHLPVMPPGAPFGFYVDPHAGLDRILEPGGRAWHAERTEGTERFHYTWMTTRDYRKRFGYLSFACPAASELFMPVHGSRPGVPAVLDNNWTDALLWLDERTARRIPAEVLQEGEVWLTGLVHREASRPDYWLPFIHESGLSSTWGNVPQGHAMVQRILDGCRVWQAAPRADCEDEATQAIAQMLAPERARLRAEVVSATQRVREFLY